MDTPPIPLFNWGALPEAEHDRARHIQNQLLALKLLEEHFESAVLLVEHAQQRDAAAWAAMAADSAILTLYNFRSTLNSILDGVGRCPILKRRVSTKRLHRIVHEFDAAFPDWLPLRDGVCHYSDKMFSPPKTWAFRLDCLWSRHGFMWKDTIHYETSSNRTVSLPVTHNELATVSRFKQSVFEAFRKACEPPQED